MQITALQDIKHERYVVTAKQLILCCLIILMLVISFLIAPGLNKPPIPVLFLCITSLLYHYN